MEEIAKVGFGAPTAKIARRADVASDTLFLYFANKEALLNELYVELKSEVHARINLNFPHKGNLECRARHVWSSHLDWALQFPEKRKVHAVVRVRRDYTPDTGENSRRLQKLICWKF